MVYILVFKETRGCTRVHSSPCEKSIPIQLEQTSEPRLAHRTGYRTSLQIPHEEAETGLD
jgi:hypothetical protein